jgi:hypothetical protein
MKILKIILLSLIFVCPLARAQIDYLEILTVVGKIYGINLDIKNNGEIQNQQLKALVKGITGTHNYGQLYFDNNNTNWGNNVTNWKDLVALSKAGGSGPLGSIIFNISKEVPIDPLNSGLPELDRMYLLSAQTSVITRSASQLTYDQMNTAEKTIKLLRIEVDKTKDSKSAADLNNRLLVEQNTLSIQQIKLISILAQQFATEAQERIVARKNDETFLKFKE